MANVKKRFPNLKIIVAHFGGFGMYDDVLEYLVGKEVWFDISLAFKNCPKELFLQIIGKHGVENILFASDCPWSAVEDNLKMLEAAGLTGYEMDSILGENAMELLELPYDYFE